MNWSAVFLAGPAGASAAVAAGGVVAFSVAMLVARLAGDPLAARWGVAGLARRGGSLTFAGIALALATRSPVPALIGFALVGAGCAALVPGALPRRGVGARACRRAPASPPSRPPATAGGVINGPAIGFLARGIGLTCAMSVLGVGAVRSSRCSARDVGSRAMKVGVVGLGAMGAGIAQLCVEAGIETVGREVSLELAEGARDRIAHFLTRKVEKGQIEQRSRHAVCGSR